jgi:SAM-dependent methyltransferase
MRLGIIGETLIERIIARTNVAPDPLLETQIAFTMARSIMAGVKLGIYDAIGTGAKTAAEVATACNTDREATAKLMNTLVGCRYLRHRDGRYQLTPKASKWLLQRSANSIADKLLFQYDEWDTVAKYEEYVATGKSIDLHSSLTDPSAWNRYQRGMRALASISAGEVAERMPVPAGATSMLDIGGSHGYYSVCACRRHEGLRATILDLSQAIEHAAPILAREGMGERISHRAGNALTDELGNESWDIVFMSQLVHHFTDEQNRDLMRRISRALRPGGVCVLLDVLRPAQPEESGGVGAVLDLYFAATSRSGTWPLATMQSWQRDAGLTVAKPIHLRTLPGAALVVGHKPPTDRASM